MSNNMNVLELTLQGELVGYVAGYQNGHNVLSFADEFKHNPNRPTFSLTTHPDFPRAEQFLSESHAKNQLLYPVLSHYYETYSLAIL